METTIYPSHYRKTDDTIQTVEEHLIGTGNLCASYAKDYGFEWTGRLLGILHDIGKYTDEFLTYITEGICREKEGLPPLSKTIDHGKYGAIFLLNNYPDNCMEDKVMKEIMAMVVCYHHGGLEDYITEDLQCKIQGRCGDLGESDLSYREACSRFYKRVMKYDKIDEILQKSSKEFQKYCKLKEQWDSFNLHLLIKVLYSCLIDADRYDTYSFVQKYEEESFPLDAKIPVSRLWEIFDEKLMHTELRLRKRTVKGALEAKIQELRQDIWKQCSDYGTEPEGIYTLTVPTGGGKTLSSLRYAINHAIKYHKKRIIYILPFTTIIEQNAAVVRDVLEAGDYLLEHHSNVIHQDETADSRDNSSSEENSSYYRLLTEQWSSPIIFTTMVQFLNSVFAGGTQNIRRLHNLSDAIMIFDEIQALPINCISLFNRTINYLRSDCRDTILLCSATQPNLEQVEFGINIDGEIILNLREKFQQFRRMEVKSVLPRGGMSIAELGEFIVGRKRENNSILTIMNTKSIAERIYREVKERFEGTDVKLYFLSTNLCSAHRKKIIKEMKEKLAEGQNVICISTQLIEAGVDISFSCVIRHIAGIDSIAQAVGRGNRNGEDEVKNAYIVQVEGENLGTLDTIRYGEEATMAVLNAFECQPEHFDHDLLSPKTLSYYYEKFYQIDKVKGQMNYPIKNSKETILEMLSDTNRRNEYYYRFNKECPTILQYKFRTAGRYFQVIDDVGTSVVVPYEKGMELVRKLIDSAALYPERRIIREAQQYAVNISKKTYETLKEQGVISIAGNSGVLVLNQRFYDPELGVVTEGRKMEVAMF